MRYDMEKSWACIRQLRLQHGFTQDELAKTLNIGRSTLSRIEVGERSCPADLLAQLAVLFNVSVDYLLFGEVRCSFLEVAGKAKLKKDAADLISQLTKLEASL